MNDIMDSEIIRGRAYEHKRDGLQYFSAADRR